MTFTVNNLIETNTFFPTEISGDSIVDIIKKESDDSFGDEIRQYFFYNTNYTVSFVYDEKSKQLLAEQAEFNITKKQFNLEEYQDFRLFIKNKSSEIEDVYVEDSEYVVFLKNGVNMYFNDIGSKILLQKVTSKDKPSRDLVIKTMIKLNEDTMFPFV